MSKDDKKDKKVDASEKTEAKTTGFDMSAAVDDYMTGTPIQENGIRHVSKDFISNRLKTNHGVDMDMVHKYHEAMRDERSAIAKVTERDLGVAIEDLKAGEGNEDAIKAATASTSFWRHDGEETLTVIACDESGDTTVDEGGNVVPVTKHGRIRTSIAGSDGIHRNTAEEVAATVVTWF